MNYTEAKERIEMVSMFISGISEATTHSFEEVLSITEDMLRKRMMLGGRQDIGALADLDFKTFPRFMLSNQDKADLDLIRKVRSGEIKKQVCAAYTLINGDFYRAHPPLCCTTEIRVMTVDEVRQMGKRNMERGKKPHETCIYERRGGSRLEICSPLWDEPQFEGDESHLDIQYLFIGTDEYDIVPVKKYGWEIRCWSGCPSDERREVEKWNV